MDKESQPKRRRWRRRARTQPMPMADALAKAFDKLGLTDQARRLRIMAVWPAAVGDAVAERTEVQSFSRGVLTVRSHSAAWRNELTFLKKELVGQVNQALGSHVVSELRIVSGRIQKPKRPVTKKRPPAVDPRDRERASSTAEPIADPEVRKAFARLMQADLTWRRQDDD